MNDSTIAATMRALGVKRASARAVERLRHLDGAESARCVLESDGVEFYPRFLEQQESSAEHRTYWHERKESES